MEQPIVKSIDAAVWSHAVTELRLALLAALDVLPDCDNPHADDVIKQARRAIKETVNRSMSDQARCSLCGEPMPAGEEMFNYHGYSGPCPKPPDESLPISNEEATSVLAQLLSETLVLFEQEQCHVDWLRVQALRLALRHLSTVPVHPVIGSGNQATKAERAGATRRSAAP